MGSRTPGQQPVNKATKNKRLTDQARRNFKSAKAQELNLKRLSSSAAERTPIRIIRGVRAARA